MTSKSQNNSRSTSPVPNQNIANAIGQTLTALAITPQSNLNLPAVQSVLNTFPTSTKSATVQTQFLNNVINATKIASNKILNENPPFAHLSSKDCAPQLSLESDKLTVKGAFRGYRMVRGSHGVSSGNWYFEVMILNPPKVSEVVKSLPKNVRLGEELKEGLREGMMKEREEMRNKLFLDRQEQLEQLELMRQGKLNAKQQLAGGSNPRGDDNMEEGNKKKKRKIDDDVHKKNTNTASSTHSVAGQLRVGWSMRTGELQAPVGYDEWSYGYRSISGSRVHNSQREDKWGGEDFGPGDIIGFAISLVDENGNNSTAAANNNAINTTAFGTTTKTKNSQPQTNHIRFFKNGENQGGDFIISRGIRSGGAAFDNIQKGSYYPAISPYMGGAARINFGPHFIHPPRGLPSGMKVRPLSEVCSAPPTADDVFEMFKKEKVFGKKIDESLVKILNEAVQTEAQMRYECYQKHLEENITEVRKARTDRGLSTSDLPDVEQDETMKDSDL
jgi:Set1/Ash2 histone methyltransferase complex subunit ASH2